MAAMQIRQPGIVGLILAGMLAMSGCSGGDEGDRTGERTSVAETPASKTEPPATDPAISPIDISSSEIVDVVKIDPPPVTDTETSTPPAEEPPPVTDTATSTPPAEEPPPVTDTATSTPPAEEPPPVTDTATSTPPAEVPPPATDTATSTPPAEEPPPATDTETDAAEVDTPTEGQLVTVADTKPGLTRIGAAKCKICHKVQYASWAESKHAARTPPLDCESCHGSGSEYKKKSIMKDPDLARAAGLVDPDKSFCVSGSCHQNDWQDDMLERAHAHKDAEAG